MQKNDHNRLWLWLIGLLFTQVSFAQIDAVDDFIAIPGNGVANNQQLIANVLANDVLNGNPINLSQVTITEIDVQEYPWMTLHADGSVWSASSLDRGSYIIRYRICDSANPNNCDIATARVSVSNNPTPPINITNAATCDNPSYTAAIDVGAYMQPQMGVTFYLSVNGVSVVGRYTEEDIQIVENLEAGAMIEIVIGDAGPGNILYLMQFFIDEQTQACGNGAIRINAFYDTNNNGHRDAGERLSKYGTFKRTLNGTTEEIATPFGFYTFYDDNPANVYTLSYAPSDYSCSSTYQANTVYNNVTATPGTTAVYNFPITTAACTDFAVYITETSRPRPGLTYSAKITLANYGNTMISFGYISFTRDSRTPIISIPGIYGIDETPTGFYYSFDYLFAGEVRTIDVVMSVPAIPNIALGDELINTVTSGIVTAEDGYTINDNATLHSIVIASYDPNDITEHHGPKVKINEFSEEDFLTYTIRFENTGNAEALDVMIHDLLDAQLDASTIRMISASHYYVMNRVDNNVTWMFPDIDLPPSVENTTIGKGYLTFQIKPMPGFAVGDIIPNQADIYFDTNPAIVTNEFETEFVAPLAVDQFASDGFSMYPNPTKNHVNIGFKNTKIESVSVSDLLGKMLFTQAINRPDAQIDLSAISKGVYFVKVKTAGSEKTFKVIRE